VGNHQNEDGKVSEGNKEIMAGVHNFAFGSTSDIIVMSESLRYCKENRYKIAANTVILFKRTIRKIKLWTTDQVITRETMPNINDPIPDSWETFQGPSYDIICSWYPFFTRDFDITKKTTWESDDSIVNLTSTKKGCCGLIKMISEAQAGTLDDTKTCERFTSRAFRLILDEPKDKYNEKNSPMSIDGDIFRVTIMQGF